MIRPVLVANCRKSAVHWFSIVMASAGGMLKAIEIRTTIKAMTRVSRAFFPLKSSGGVFLSQPPRMKIRAPMNAHTKTFAFRF
ncbi:MAG: hypothetical protein H3Z52_11600 [archaeon]|nr:hypothetical protein [archaeon]